MLSMKPFLIINVVLFQTCWLVAAFYPEYAALVITALLLLHFGITPTRRLDFKILLMGLLGCVIDQTLISFNVINVEQSTIPLWLVTLWLFLSVCLNHSLAWLARFRTWQVAILGSVFGTLSYVAALNIGAFTTPLPFYQFVIIEILVWFLLLPIMIKFKRVIHSPKKVTYE